MVRIWSDSWFGLLSVIPLASQQPETKLFLFPDPARAQQGQISQSEPWFGFLSKCLRHSWDLHQQPQHEIFFHLSQSQGELWRHVPSVLQPSQCSLFISWSFQAFWPTFSLDPFQHHLTPYIWFVAIYRTLIHLYVRSEKWFLLEPGRNHSSEPYSSSEYGRYPGSCQSLAGADFSIRTVVITRRFAVFTWV